MLELPEPHNDQIEHHATFKKFVGLPPELRDEIWKMGCRIPRIVTMSCLPRVSPYPWSRWAFDLDSRTPKMLQICHEARDISSSSYRRMDIIYYLNARDTAMFFNPDSDIIYLTLEEARRGAVRADVGALRRMVIDAADGFGNQQRASDIENLAISMSLWYGAYRSPSLGIKYWVAKIQASFRGLKSVSIVHQEWGFEDKYVAYNGKDESHLEFIDPADLLEALESYDEESSSNRSEFARALISALPEQWNSLDYREHEESIEQAIERVLGDSKSAMPEIYHKVAVTPSLKRRLKLGVSQPRRQ